MCVCVRERERESNGRDGETLCMKGREGVCVREREREREQW